MLTMLRHNCITKQISRQSPQVFTRRRQAPQVSNPPQLSQLSFDLTGPTKSTSSYKPLARRLITPGCRMLRRGLMLGLAVLALLHGAAASDNCYDHQTKTYDARFKPTYCIKTCTVTPFFSPDTSISTYVNLIEAAKENIDIYTPG